MTKAPAKNTKPSATSRRTPKATAQSTPKTATAAAALPAPQGPRINKTDAVIAMLRGPDGASVDEIMGATGWQRHSVRGALAGAVKKKLGAAVTSEVVEGVRRYRAPEAAA